MSRSFKAETVGKAAGTASVVASGECAVFLPRKGVRVERAGFGVGRSFDQLSGEQVPCLPGDVETTVRFGGEEVVIFGAHSMTEED